MSQNYPAFTTVVGVHYSYSIICLHMLGQHPCGRLKSFHRPYLQTLFFSGGSLAGLRVLGLSGVLGALLQRRLWKYHLISPRWLERWNDVICAK